MIEQSHILDAERAQMRALHMRAVMVSTILMIGFALVIYRSISLHTFRNDSLNKVARRQYQAVVPVSARRGAIKDAKGSDLAVSVPIQSIYGDPSAIEDPASVVNALSRILSIENPKNLLHRLNSPRKFVWIERRVDPIIAEKVKALDLPGVHFIQESKRVYPYGDLAAPVLGAAGFDSRALAGAEMAYDSYLKSQRQKVYYERDARGRFYFSPASYMEQTDIGTVELTIDRQIQYYTERALKKAFQGSQSKDAVAIVMDVNNGAILAMASLPSFDPNDYSKYPQASWRNRAVTDAFEPGSTLKVLVAAGAIDEKLVQIEQKFDCENGKFQIGRAVINDHNPHGLLTTADIIKVSSNIGMIKIGQHIGAEKLYSTLKKFHISEKTGIDFPGEVSGLLRSHKSWAPVELATIAFGQGLLTTPLQMISAYAAIANGGTLYQPYLVKQVTNEKNVAVYSREPIIQGHPIRPETAALITRYMEQVVEEGGTGILAASRDYRVAGKTGTAQKVDESGGYGKGKYYSSFIGFAPSDKPRLAVLVAFNEPQGAYYGGTVAAPVFREIIEASLRYMEVPSANTQIVVKKEYRDLLPPATLGSLIEPSTPLFIKLSDGQLEVPSLIGLTMRDVLESAANINVHLKLKGSGLVARQSPAGGTQIKEGAAVSVQFELPN